MKIIIIDNYDSFTFNLVQLVGRFVKDVEVRRNDKITLAEIEKINPDKIIISPGPGKPENSKVTLDVLKKLSGVIPILGVCLGHQAIGSNFGAKTVYAEELMHGKTSKIIHDEKTIFRNLPQNFEAGRYHSLVLDEKTISAEVEISAWTSSGVIMGIRHKTLNVEGIQFHPESILTPLGAKIICNWIEQKRESTS